MDMIIKQFRVKWKRYFWIGLTGFALFLLMLGLMTIVAVVSDEREVFNMGTTIVIFEMILYSVIVNIFELPRVFSDAVGMGCTRKRFFLGHYLSELLFMLAVGIVFLGVNQAELFYYTRLLPGSLRFLSVVGQDVFVRVLTIPHIAAASSRDTVGGRIAGFLGRTLGSVSKEIWLVLGALAIAAMLAYSIRQLMRADVRQGASF